MVLGVIAWNLSGHETPLGSTVTITGQPADEAPWYLRGDLFLLTFVFFPASVLWIGYKVWGEEADRKSTWRVRK